MMEYFADLHVHIGSARNKPVKITASRKLTLKNIFEMSVNRKGIDIVGIVDAASPLVIEELQEYIEKEELIELKKGGLLYAGNLTVILGAEIETEEKQGVAHSIAFFPYFENIRVFSKVISKYIKNIELSSQKAKLSAYELYKIVKDLGGLLMPAHVFTPHKSFYGSCYDSLIEAFGEYYDCITVVELGLSSDTDLADTIKELREKTFVTNSDAHSFEKIGREHNKLKLESCSFDNLVKAFQGDKNNYVIANYGLNPKLGKYHRTLCLDCDYIADQPPPVKVCPRCNSQNIVLGVLDRISIISDYDKPVHPLTRPPYYYQVPLEFIPGLGKKNLEKLLTAFGSEMKILHKVSEEELCEVVGEKIAKNIVLGRKGELKMKVGGGGIYGKIIL